MDIIDSANEVVMRDINVRIRKVRSTGYGPDESATECEACGSEIPEARRLAAPGCTLCVKCKSAQEEAIRRHG